MFKKINLILAAFIIGFIAKADSPIYQFDYNQSIINTYKPVVSNMEARYEYRQ